MITENKEKTLLLAGVDNIAKSMLVLLKGDEKHDLEYFRKFISHTSDVTDEDRDYTVGLVEEFFTNSGSATQDVNSVYDHLLSEVISMSKQ